MLPEPPPSPLPLTSVTGTSLGTPATPPRQLLIVEDDVAFARTLRRSFERRGYGVAWAGSVTEVAPLLAAQVFTHAVVDLKLNQASGLGVVRQLHQHDAGMLIVVLTGFASIATAVEAIKLGACDYLVKPSNTDDIEAAFGLEDAALAGESEADIGGTSDEKHTPVRPTSIKTLEMERIHEVLAETGFNISETARRLGMHRRTLARKLAKRWVP